MRWKILSKIVNKKYIGIALDPIHVGAGGYRIGRVDNSIIRELATNVPKIPGTSLAGVLREYSTLYFMETSDELEGKNYEVKRANADKKINVYYGDENKQGILRFYDSQILFFPVSSIKGTIWVTTKNLLEYYLKGQIQLSNNKMDDIDENKAIVLRGIESTEPINLGWLLLEIEKSTENNFNLKLPADLDGLVKKIIVVSEKLFSPIVNDNLEVRTSVRIDPKTGTAEDKHLFTYEAIPRGTILGLEITIDNLRESKKDVDSIINGSLAYLKMLGIGGMGTRGFGRMELFEIKSKEGGNN